MSEAVAGGAPPRLTFNRWLGLLAVAAVAWGLVYAHLSDFADVVVAGFGG